MQQIDERIIKGAFFDFMRECGIKPRDNLNLIMDGRIHRFAVECDRGNAKSGAYFLHSDEWPNGGAMDYHIHSEMQKFKLDKNLIEPDSRPVLSREEYERMKIESERRQQEREIRQKENDRKAILSAWNEYQMPYSLECFGNHPYLRMKHIDNADTIKFGVIEDCIFRVKTRSISNDDVCNIGDLLIPLVDAKDGQFISLIHVSEQPQQGGNFLKPFYTGTHPKGACVELIPLSCRTQHDPTPEPLYSELQRKYRGDLYQKRNSELKADRVYICEGIATGFAVLELTECKNPVLCACSCHNLIHVAKAWRKRYPKLQITIKADNDEAGLDAAIKTVKAGYANYIDPAPIEGYDWNDYLSYKKGFGKRD